MVGQNVYTEQEIVFLLDRFIDGKEGPEIMQDFLDRFDKRLTANQLRYVRNKYGKDPKYNTALINTVMGRKRKRRERTSSPDSKPSPSKVVINDREDKDQKEAKKVKRESPPVKEETPTAEQQPHWTDFGMLSQPRQLDWNMSQLSQPRLPQTQMHQADVNSHVQPAMSFQTSMAYPQFDFSPSFFTSSSVPVKESTSSYAQPQRQIPGTYHQQMHSPYQHDDQSLSMAPFTYNSSVSNMNLTALNTHPAFAPPTHSQHSMTGHGQPRLELHGMPMDPTYDTSTPPQYASHLLLNQPPPRCFPRSHLSPSAERSVSLGLGYASPQKDSPMPQDGTPLGDFAGDYTSASWKPCNQGYCDNSQQLYNSMSSTTTKPLMSSHAAPLLSNTDHVPNHHHADAPTVVSNQLTTTTTTTTTQNLPSEPTLDHALTINLDAEPFRFIETTTATATTSDPFDDDDDGPRVPVPSPSPRPGAALVELEDVAVPFEILYSDLDQGSLTGSNDAAAAAAAAADDDTIDPKLLAEMYTLPPLQLGGTMTPASEELQAPAGVVRVEEAV